MVQTSGGGNVSVPLRTMIFIDAGYFTKYWVQKICNIPRDQYNYRQFSIKLATNSYSTLSNSRLIRTYYYDGQYPDTNQSQFQEQKKFHDWLDRAMGNFEVKCGQLVKQNDGDWEQKGVDTIMAIDMISKAYRDQYDVAILVSGDADHIPAVKEVKNSGKQVYGVYFDSDKISQSYSKDLITTLDLGYVLGDKHDGIDNKIGKGTTQVQN